MMHNSLLQDCCVNREIIHIVACNNYDSIQSMPQLYVFIKFHFNISRINDETDLRVKVSWMELVHHNKVWGTLRLGLATPIAWIRGPKKRNIIRADIALFFGIWDGFVAKMPMGDL